MKHLLKSTLIALALATLPATAQEFSFKFQSSDPAGNPNFELQQGWTETLAEKTGGRVKIELLPVGSVVEHNETQDAIAAGILDGHIILNRNLGARNHWPAIDVLPSLSRVMSGIASEEHKEAAGRLRQVLATYEKQRDLILLGAYQYGTDPETDYAIDKIEAVEAFLRQRTEDNTPFDDAIQHMINLFY